MRTSRQADVGQKVHLDINAKFELEQATCRAVRAAMLAQLDVVAQTRGEATCRDCASKAVLIGALQATADVLAFYVEGDLETAAFAGVLLRSLTEMACATYRKMRDGTQPVN